MTATSSRNAARSGCGPDDDFWANAPAAAWQPSRPEEQQASPPGARDGLGQGEHRAREHANDSGPARRVAAPRSWPGRLSPRALMRRTGLPAAGVAVLLGVGVATVVLSRPTAELVHETRSGADFESRPAAPIAEAPTAAPAESSAEMAPTPGAKVQALRQAATAPGFATAGEAHPQAAKPGAEAPDARPQEADTAAAQMRASWTASVTPSPAQVPDAFEAEGQQPGPLAAAGPPVPEPDGPGVSTVKQDVAQEPVERVPDEPQTLAEADAAFEAPSPAATSASEIDVLVATARKAQVTKYVNMRVGPGNDAAVITVIPANAPVSVIDCNGWCHVIYGGEQGWVYESFVSGADTDPTSNG